MRGRCQYSQLELLRHRIYGLVLGYEDLNDRQALRHDRAIQTAVGVLNPLAIPSTLHRTSVTTSSRRSPCTRYCYNN